jgi:toxin FitB
MYLLDTNVVSELRKPRPHGAVIAWIEGIPDNEIFISALTLGELQAGVERNRQLDREKAVSIEAWIEQLSESYEVISMDGSMFREWARLMAGRSDHLLEDAMIAATARVRELIVVTRNVRDFRPLW